MARTKIREQQVIDADFASELEAQQFINDAILLHEQSGIHVPKPDPLLDDTKILRYDSILDSYVLIPQADIKTIALPYYWDDVRKKYLDNQVQRVMFYKNGTNKMNTWMNYAPAITSSNFPFEIRQGEDSCLVSFEYSTTDLNTGTVIELRDKNNDDLALASLNLGTTPVDYLYNNNLNIDFNAGIAIASRILGTTLDNSVLVLGFRKIYNPQ